MLKAETRMTNEAGYVFLILDCEDQVKAGFHRLETAVESVRMSLPNDVVARLDDRTSYTVILVDPCNGGEEEYRGCILKQPMSSIPVGVIGL